MALGIPAFLQLTLALISTTAVGHVDGCLELQQSEWIWEKEDRSVSIPCLIDMSNCKSSTPETVWYIFTKDSHRQLDLESQPSRYSLGNQSLNIHFLKTTDSGVYYCAVSLKGVMQKGAQVIGHGTTVTVTVVGNQVKRATLWTLFVMVTLYSLIILTVLICKTARGSSLRTRKCRKSGTKNTSTRRAHFRAVVQEYSKRKLRSRGTDAASPDNKVENPHSPHIEEDDDIYQNV